MATLISAGRKPAHARGQQAAAGRPHDDRDFRAALDRARAEAEAAAAAIRNLDARIALLVATVNAWNRVAICFRSVHPVKPTRPTRPTR